MESTLQFMHAVRGYRESQPERLRPTWAKITTITMISSHLKDAGQPLDPDVMRQVFRKIRTIPVHRKGGKEPTNWRIFYSDFYNQVTIGYEDAQSTKKVKIFPNGALQVAGCADLVDCKNFSRQLCLILKLVYGVDVPESSFRIVMINANFSLNHTVDLYRLVDIFPRVTFDPDRYSAVKIKHKPNQKDTTTSIFASGAVIITGANCIEDIFETYKYVTDKCVQGGVFLGDNDQSEKFQRFMGFRVQ